MIKFDNFKDKPISNWTLDDAERTKDLFRQQRPKVSKHLARALWQYWHLRFRGKLLFDNVEDNIALLLHARAYGENVPEADDKGFIADFLREHAELYAPLMPPRLNWGPHAILAREVLAGLDSPVLHAWVFVEGAAAQQILIVGEGLPEIRQQVVPAAFMASLQVHGVANDMMNIGVLRVEMPGIPVTPLNIPVPIIGDHRIPLSPAAAETASAALQELHGFLKKLEQESGLVQVHRVDYADQKALSDTLKRYAGQALANPNSAFLWQNDSANSKPDLVTPIPYWQTAGDTMVLSLPLSADLLRTPAYERLGEAYYDATVQRVLMDASTRRVYYEREGKRLKVAKEEYEKANREKRIAVWGETVLLTEKFDFDTGVPIQLLTPEEISTEQYFQENVPSLIEKYSEWEMRMQRIILSVREAFNRSDAPVHRFAASRFLDAAVRERLPDESQAALSAFEPWCAQVQSMLWFEWRCFLKSRGIEPEHLFTPHTFFHTWIIPERKGTAQLMMSPFTLVDQDRSAALFDSKRKVMAVNDPTDYAEPSIAIPQSHDQLWQSLKATAEQPDTTEEKFASDLREGLRQAPLDMMKRILETLLESHQTGQQSSSSGRAKLEDNLKTAMQKSDVSRRIGHALVAQRVQAFQSARQFLNAPAANRNWTARIHLLRAVIECLAVDKWFADELPAIFHGRRYGPLPAIQSTMDKARAADEEYVRTWIKHLESNEIDADDESYASEEDKAMAKFKAKAKVVDELLYGLPHDEKYCSGPEYAALLARGAVESVHLARELERAAATLAEEHEAIATTFSKIGWALEKILMAEFAAAPQEELVNLLEVLTGQVIPQYPTMKGTNP